MSYLPPNASAPPLYPGYTMPVSSAPIQLKTGSKPTKSYHPAFTDATPNPEASLKPKSLRSPLNPLDWNLSKLVPPLGIVSTLSWGIGSLAEHSILDGKIPKNPALKALGLYAPVLNLLYGSLNAVGAFAQGYALRGTAFSIFTTFSALCAPFMLKNNQLALKVTQALAKSPVFSPAVKTMARTGLKLNNISSLYNAVAPIGMLTGLFSMTKVAQSMPGVKLDHPTGDTLNEMLKGQKPGTGLLDVISRNVRTEWNSFGKTLLNSLQYGGKMIQDVGKGLQNIISPPEHLKNKGAFDRFLDPITSGTSVPLFYAHATIGRVLSSSAAVALFLLNANALRKHSVYDKVIKAVKSPALQSKATQNTLGRVINLALLWGQLAGSPAGLFTKFNDWPVLLSSVYRTSGIAYGLSGIGALANIAGIKQLGSLKIGTQTYSLYKNGKVLGLDERIWTKVGAFIQGSSYFVNLFIKNLSKKNDHASPEPASVPVSNAELDIPAAPEVPQITQETLSMPFPTAPPNLFAYPPAATPINGYYY